MPSIRWFLGYFITFFFIGTQSLISAEFVKRDNAILVSGEISVGDLTKLKAKLREHGKLQINLNSPGGALIEALKIGRYIREIGLATHIPAGAECASACVTVFAGGLIRTAHDNSAIGIHMASAAFNQKLIDAMEGLIDEFGIEATPYLVALFEEWAASAMLQQVYFILESGVSLRLLEATTQVSHDDVYWMSKEDAISVNLVNFH